MDTIWIDAQLSPRLAYWIDGNCPVTAKPLRDLGLRDAADEDIFSAGHVVNVIILTKDSDFVRLLEQRGSPPKVLWLTCGNTSEAALQSFLSRQLAAALDLFASGEELVEIGFP